MEKQKEQARKPRHRKVPQKKILAITTQDAKPTEEKQTKNEQTTKWYPFFKDSKNTYINDLALRAKRSPTHGAILQSKATYTGGQGFLFFKDDEPIAKKDLDTKFKNYIRSVNRHNDTLHTLFGLGAYDYAYSGNHYIEVVKSDTYTSLFYQDASKVRVNDDTAFISAYWRDIENNPYYNKTDYPVEEVELWNGDINTRQKRFIYHIKNTTPEYDYYGLPEGVNALLWADIEYKIPQFNLDLFKNGFFPSIAMSIIGSNPPEGMTPQEYVEAIRDGFTGEGNNSKMFIQMVESLEQAAQVTEFNTTRDGQFTELQELATKNIISAHRWFPSLAGISTAGALGSNQQIRNEYNIALKSVIIPFYQKPLLGAYENLIRIAGFDYDLDIINVAPVGIEDNIDPKLVLTFNEQRKILGFEADETKEGIYLKDKNEPNTGNDDGGGSENGSNSQQ
jgi:hypothetical protein